jgi:hypothetical protein
MKMNAQFVCTGSDIFVVCEGVKIARRGYPGTPQAGTWVSLEPGHRVLDKGKASDRYRIQRRARGCAVSGCRLFASDTQTTESVSNNRAVRITVTERRQPRERWRLSTGPITMTNTRIGADGDPVKPNPFDPANLRLDQSFAANLGVKKHLTTVPVRKPNKQDFVRVHPDPAYILSPAAIIELKEDRETYLVTPDIANDLPGEFVAATLYTTINRQGVVHVWPVKLPGPDGKHNEWHRSAAEAAEMAMRSWVRVTPNMSLGANEISEATWQLTGPGMAEAFPPGNLGSCIPREGGGSPRSPTGPAASRRSLNSIGN